jgi:hypothetical protein
MKSQPDTAQSFCRGHITALIERSSSCGILQPSERTRRNKAETDAQKIRQDTADHIRH